MVNLLDHEQDFSIPTEWVSNYLDDYNLISAISSLCQILLIEDAPSFYFANYLKLKTMKGILDHHLYIILHLFLEAITRLLNVSVLYLNLHTIIIADLYGI